MPLTFISSSDRWKPPCCFRKATMRSAVFCPTRGNCISSVTVAVLRFTGRWGARGVLSGAAARGRARASAKARGVKWLDMVASFQAVMSHRGLCQVATRLFAMHNFFYEKIMLLKNDNILLKFNKTNNIYIYFLYQNFEEIL